MVTVQIIVIAVMSLVVAFLAYFVIRSVVIPKQIAGIKKLTAQGKYAAAIKLAKMLIKKNARDFEAHYYLALAYLADKNPELALIELKFINQNAVFEETDIPEAEFRKKIAALYTKFNHPEDALKEYLLLTKIEANNADNFYNAGKMMEYFGKGGQALYFYQTAIKLNKRYAKAHAALGVLLFKAKQLSEAKKELDKAIALEPDMFSIYYYEGKIYKEMADYPKAVSAFEKSLRDPEFKQKAFLERGSCFIAANNIDLALIEFDKAVKASKNEGAQETLYARYFLASCYEKLRKIDDAVEQWSKIYAKNKSFKDVSAKLSQYRDLEINDSMKEYMTSSSDSFQELCRQTVEKGLNLIPQSIQPVKAGCIIIANEPKSDNWMSTRQSVYSIYFYRDTNVIEEGAIRKILDEVKNQNYSKAIICTSSTFSHQAAAFAESRPAELIDKDRLEELLAKSGI